MSRKEYTSNSLVGGSSPPSSTTKRDIWHVYITGKTGAADSKQNYDKRRGSDDGWAEPVRDGVREQKHRGIHKCREVEIGKAANRWGLQRKMNDAQSYYLANRGPGLWCTMICWRRGKLILIHEDCNGPLAVASPQAIAMVNSEHNFGVILY